MFPAKQSAKLRKQSLHLIRALIRIRLHRTREEQIRNNLGSIKETLNEDKEKVNNTIILTYNFNASNLIATAANGAGKVYKTVSGGKFSPVMYKGNVGQTGATVNHEITKEILKLGRDAYERIQIRTKGFNTSRNSILTEIISHSILGPKIESLTDITNLPFNGPTPKKPKREKKRKFESKL
ncbi:hypothetical protein MHBO_001825 [Bonamia ostreae]|uniref:Ribosomal protein S11 n=1 Tax=Bonamia ostreae TaxID=126728 RepID=A0ABV2AKW2_9EUKA